MRSHLTTIRRQNVAKEVGWLQAFLVMPLSLARATLVSAAARGRQTLGQSSAMLDVDMQRGSHNSLGQAIYFDEGDAGKPIVAGHNDGVGGRGSGQDDR